MRRDESKLREPRLRIVKSSVTLKAEQIIDVINVNQRLIDTKGTHFESIKEEIH